MLPWYRPHCKMKREMLTTLISSLELGMNYTLEIILQASSFDMVMIFAWALARITDRQLPQTMHCRWCAKLVLDFLLATTTWSCIQATVRNNLNFKDVSQNSKQPSTLCTQKGKMLCLQTMTYLFPLGLSKLKKTTWQNTSLPQLREFAMSIKLWSSGCFHVEICVKRADNNFVEGGYTPNLCTKAIFDLL